MTKADGLLAAVAALLLVAGVTGAAAQGCVESVGEASGASRDAALRQAYEAMLRRTSESAWKQWLARSQRIGEAPGYGIRKLTTNCTPQGSGTSCRVSAILCRE